MSTDTMTGRVHPLPAGAQDRMRAMRAERLARLRAGTPAQVVPMPQPLTARAEIVPGPAPESASEPAPAFAPGPAPEPEAEPEAEAALREFLRALLGDEAPVAEAPAEPVVEGSELARLPGAGPGLVAALRRAGLTSLAAVAGLEPSELAGRLGPIGRLVPAPAWVAAALAEAGQDWPGAPRG